MVFSELLNGHHCTLDAGATEEQDVPHALDSLCPHLYSPKQVQEPPTR